MGRVADGFGIDGPAAELFEQVLGPVEGMGDAEERGDAGGLAGEESVDAECGVGRVAAAVGSTGCTAPLGLDTKMGLESWLDR